MHRQCQIHWSLDGDDQALFDGRFGLEKLTIHY